MRTDLAAISRAEGHEAMAACCTRPRRAPSSRAAQQEKLPRKKPNVRYCGAVTSEVATGSCTSTLDSAGMGHTYNSWDREAAAQRALSHADGSGSSDEDGSIWNFAFGSNISAAKVRSRGMLPLAAVRGRLPGWTLLFNHTGGYANIEPADLARQMDLSKLPQPVPEETHGMLLRLSRREFAELARQEYAYDTVEVAVEVYDADGPRVQRALAFKTSPCALTTSRTLPSERYARIIREGAREASISAPYCHWLDMIKSA